MSEAVGIGIISYNRRAALERCVAAVQAFTKSPFHLVVADDGSTDGCPEWCRDQNVPVVTGANRGVAHNKNRALYYLLQRTQAEVVLLLEDDCWPCEPGWDQTWAEATSIWGHINFVPDIPDLIRSGTGIASDPYWTHGFLAQCSGWTRGVLAVVGYFDPRFHGWGWEHIEFTWRCTDLLRLAWGERPGPWPCLRAKVETPGCGTFSDPVQADRNHALFERIRKDESGNDRTLRREPWASPHERAEFLLEQEGAGDLRAL